MTIIVRDNVQLELKSGIDDTQATVTFLAAVAPYADPPQPGAGEEVELIITDRLSSPTKIEKLTATAIVDDGTGDWECTVTRGNPAHEFDPGAVALLAPTAALVDQLTKITPDRIDAINAWRTGYVPSVTAAGEWKWINKTDLDISLVDPGRGSVDGNTLIHIYGAGFEDGVDVKVAGTSATSINVVSSRHITCETPPGSAGDADITIDRPDGATFTRTNAFTYEEDQPDGDPDPAVSVNSLDPNSGPEAGGTTATVHGSGFVDGATTTLDGVSASTTFQDSETLEIVTPAGEGTVDVVVTNPDSSEATLLNGFTYEPDLDDGRG